ncbi:hypothetical protein [Streptomyces sp. gCLA4]|uniref:hypothetical protein n=1 Tax=Streptomyces sp. gCLA4 TaxID=1873416 RepID=UPI001603EE57|nr:hypothetical protein [Streptomyces sp. gCLA4]
MNHVIGASYEGALRGAFGAPPGSCSFPTGPATVRLRAAILGLVREDEAAADDTGARAMCEAAEKRPAEDQEQTNN